MNGGNGEQALLQQNNDDKLKNEEEGTTFVAGENSWLCVYTVMISVSSVMLSTGLGAAIINCQLPFLKAFYNASYQEKYNESISESTMVVLESCTGSGMLFGGLFGAMSITLVLQMLSRKQALIFINILNTLGVAICCLGGWFFQSPYPIIFGRILTGFFAGCGMNLTPIIVAETATLARTAFYLSMIGVNLSLGGVLGLCTAFLSMEWQVVLIFAALPSVIYLLSSPFLPDTPFNFVLAGKRSEAANTLRRLRMNISETEVEKTLNAIEEEHKRSTGNNESISLVEIFQSPYYRRLLFVVVMVFMQSQLCGINAVGLYTVNIFHDTAGFDYYTAFVATAVIFAIQFLVAAFGSVAIHWWGTKKLNVYTSFTMSLSLSLLTAALYTYETVPAMKYISIISVGVYINAWACGVNITLFPMVTAYTTGPTRESAFKFAGIIFWILSWFVGFIGPFLWAENSLYHGAFIPFAVMNLLFAVYVLICLPETGGKTPDEIQEIIQKRGKPTNGSNPTDELL